MKINQHLFGSLNFCVEKLKQQEIIAYPTEAVFGLGCDPDSKSAVISLLKLKQRSIKKGLILIAADYSQLEPYFDARKLTKSQSQKMCAHWPGHITYIVPAMPCTPYWLTGDSEALAIRVSDHPEVQSLCNIFGKPLISTSANFSGKSPCRNVIEVAKQFGASFPVLYAPTGGQYNPSEIRNAISGEIIRQG